MNYAQKYDLFFPFFLKVVVNKSKAYSFLIIGIMHLQKILLSFIILRFHFFTAKQGTWVHKDDRGPLEIFRMEIQNACTTSSKFNQLRNVYITYDGSLGTSPLNHGNLKRDFY